MKSKDAHTILIFALLLIVFILFSSIYRQKFEGQTAGEWYEAFVQESTINLQTNSKIADLENELEDYENALQEANSVISKAKYHAWESYEEMGEALDNLETVSP